MSIKYKLLSLFVFFGVLGLLTVSANEDLRNNIVDTFQPKGSLQVTTEPADEQVSIYIDGDNKGETPLEIKRLDVGKHTLKVVKEGYKESFQEVLIETKKTATVKISLTGDTIFQTQGENIQIIMELEVSSGQVVSTANFDIKTCSNTFPSPDGTNIICLQEKVPHKISARDGLSHIVDMVYDNEADGWQNKTDKELWISKDKTTWTQIYSGKDIACTTQKYLCMPLNKDGSISGDSKEYVCKKPAVAGEHYCEVQDVSGGIWTKNSREYLFTEQNVKNPENGRDYQYSPQLYVYNVSEGTVSKSTPSKQNFSGLSLDLLGISPDDNIALIKSSSGCCGDSLIYFGFYDLSRGSYSKIFGDQDVSWSLSKATFTGSKTVTLEVENGGGKEKFPYSVTNSGYTFLIKEIKQDGGQVEKTPSKEFSKESRTVFNEKKVYFTDTLQGKIQLTSSDMKEEIVKDDISCAASVAGMKRTIGNFFLSLLNDKGEVIAEKSIGEKEFDSQTAHDGNLLIANLDHKSKSDFVMIFQYGSCNGDLLEIYGVSPSGGLKQYEFKQSGSPTQSSIFVSNIDEILQIQGKTTELKTNFYNNADGKTTFQTWSFDGSETFSAQSQE